MDRTAPIGHTQWAIPMIIRCKIRITIFVGMLINAQSDVQLIAKVLGTIHSQQVEIVLHGNGDWPSNTTGRPAFPHFAGKVQIIIRH